jgi:uncharacterized protein (DUF433 family)
MRQLCPTEASTPSAQRAIICEMRTEQAFERRPDLCGGQPVIRGTRFPLLTVLASLAEGATIDEIIADFPTVSLEQVRAVIAFAAASAGEDLPVPGVPALE